MQRKRIDRVNWSLNVFVVVLTATLLSFEAFPSRVIAGSLLIGEVLFAAVVVITLRRKRARAENAPNRDPNDHNQ